MLLGLLIIAIVASVLFCIIAPAMLSSQINRDEERKSGRLQE
jgi:hypothetical protein